ncbi:MAG: hypothetical protein M1826_001170 [Phylliscum demangeonii]|nr:MAG: hypothetical protein M1826_001170 [Phylliscum demangeonii]
MHLLPTLLLPLLFTTAAWSLPLPPRYRLAQVPVQTATSQRIDDYGDYGLGRLRTNVQRVLPLTVGLGAGAGANFGSRLGPEVAAEFATIGVLQGTVAGVGVGFGNWAADRLFHRPCTATSDGPPVPLLLAGVGGTLGGPPWRLKWPSSVIGGVVGSATTWIAKHSIKAMDPQAGLCPHDRF